MPAREMSIPITLASTACLDGLGNPHSIHCLYTPNTAPTCADPESLPEGVQLRHCFFFIVVVDEKREDPYTTICRPA